MSATLFVAVEAATGTDRKSTRLNSSHGYISYAVFCLKKKKTINIQSKSQTTPSFFENKSQRGTRIAFTLTFLVSTLLPGFHSALTIMSYVLAVHISST